MDGRRLVRHARDFVADHESRLEHDFPGLFFGWIFNSDALHVETQSRNGTRGRARVSYPLDMARLGMAAQRHLDGDADLDELADRLVSTMGGYDQSHGHLAYILRWLVFPQGGTVEFGDHPDVSPIVRSPAVALVRVPGRRRLKLWADGTAVLHYDSPSDDEKGRESAGLDITRINLRDFQDLWLPLDRRDVAGEVRSTLDALPSPSYESAAVRLLIDYGDAAWLRHHRFAQDCMSSTVPGAIDWTATDRLASMNTEATVQDRAVLAVACHLSDQVTPTVSLADAIHHVGSARAQVMDAIARLVGRHPEPDRGWPIDCPTCP